MITGADVLEMYLPEGGWIIAGNDYSGITWVDESVKITKAKFESGFAEYQTFRNQQEADKAAAKSALLTRLGISEDEAKLLLS